MNYTKLSLIIKSKQKPPYFIGSQIRGAFGYALKKVTCINPAYVCDGCFASLNCLYHQFYEEKNIYHKYRLDFELGKNYYDFSFYLFDNVCEKLPYIISALHMMLTQNGLGKEKVKYEVFEMFVNDESCVQNGKIVLPKDFIKKFEIENRYENIKLKFCTPLRIKKENRFLKSDEIELNSLINSIYQRQMKLLGRDYKKFPYEIKGEIINKNLQFKELTRLSNRQKTTMNMGGLIGEIEFKNLNKECFEVLKLGELLGVGKQTVFGLGKIEMEELSV
ncbi:CRISPR system precrRNA processing endoribonuclease RAMP protein Cas6 [Aliarcobacter cryaerophilus]|uniref:CRISPR system precrRNA processing endoribonuclease RAMP protein Cas6 n=1 Tax=Aliarcobacter cryaerophilus TaxID=28198 RepID=UPI0021B6D827|nr:CRISPR system precrRNA processing endoribonuclease RAMP protein Cas6 [Aliarcobacter cryaerophilus]MCT7519239.1 CRISPR system precrRNA processing endoribonuclease RAMP protein Cas6 [Aliarcobacter cryaerophilus]